MNTDRLIGIFLGSAFAGGVVYLIAQDRWAGVAASCGGFLAGWVFQGIRTRMRRRRLRQ